MADKVDGVELLARLSGMSREDVKAEMARVETLVKARNACAGHRFETNNANPHPTRKLRCAVCGYDATATEALLYEQGLRHGAEMARG